MGLRQSALNIVIRAKDLTQGALKRFRTNVKETNRTAERARGGLRRLATTIGATVAAYASFRTVTAIVGSVLGTGDKFEKLALQMRAAMGSIEEGERATEWIKEFTRDTPLQLEDTTQAFLRLKNFGLDPMDGTLQAVVDQNEKLGGGQERLTGIANALGQAWAKQKLQGEEILQLIERGVPVWELLAESTGKTTAELQKMSERGQLTRDVIKDLIKEMGEASTGAAAANMSRLAGITSNLRDRFTEWLNAVAEAGVLDFFKAQLQDVSRQIEQLAKNGTLQRWAEQASAAIVNVFNAGKGMLKFLYDARGAIILFGKAWAGIQIARLVGGMRNLVGSIAGIGPGMSTAASATRAFGAALKGIAIFTVVEGVIRVTSAVRQWISAERDLAATRAQTATVQEEAQRRIEQFREQTGLAAESIDDLVKAQENGVAIFDAANDQWITGAEAVAEFKAGLDNVKEGVEDTAEVVEDQLTTAVQAGIKQFESLTESGKRTDEALEELFDGYDLKTTQDVTELIAILGELEKQGVITAETIENKLGQALRDFTADELTAFAINAQFAFETGRAGAQEFADTINNTVSAALRNLQVDIELVETGISGVGAEAIRNFQVVAQNIEDSGDSAEVAGDKIVAAFVAAFNKVKTEAGRQKLLAELNKAVKEGTLNTLQFNEALKLVGAKEGSEKVNQLIERIRKLKKELKEAGDEGEEVGDKVEEGADTGGSAMALIITAIGGFKAELRQLSAAAEEAFDQLALGMEPAGDEAERTRDRIHALGLEIEEIRRQSLRLGGVTGFQEYVGGLRKIAREVEIAFLEQKQAAQELFQTFDEGGISYDRFIQKAERMIETSELLDNEDLSNLRRGIDQASAAMDRLNESTDRTLASLQSKLDRLRGDTEAAERRQFEQQIADLERQLEIARAQRNNEAVADLEESLRVAKEIFEVEKEQRAQSRREREERARERQARDQARAREQSQRDPAPAGGQTTPGTQQVIELRAGGKDIQISTDDPSGLLELLANAGLRTST